jgi:sugar phosphate permease
VLVFGMTCLGAGMLLLSGIDANGSFAADVLGPSILAAAGIGCSFVPVTIAATAGVDGREAGLASGLVNTSRQVGGGLGLALLATLATARTADLEGVASKAEALTAGFQRSFVVGGCFALAGALVALVVLVRGARRPDPGPVARPAAAPRPGRASARARASGSGSPDDRSAGARGRGPAARAPGAPRP